MIAGRRRRRILAPETIQTSTVDCGPAALQSLLEGYRIHVSFARLREACQTQLDGTSIDTIEEVANQLGLAVEQVIVPPDHLLLPRAGLLPAVVVTDTPTGEMHFVVVWRRHGRWLQVMDPQSGRRWLSARAFLRQVHLHSVTIPAADWREWAASGTYPDALRGCAGALGLPHEATDALLGEALADPSWRSLATLEAALRMVSGLVADRCVGRGAEAGGLAAGLMRRALATPTKTIIPNPFHSVQAAPHRGDALAVRGAVILTVRSGRPAVDVGPAAALPADLLEALRPPPARSLRDIRRAVADEGGWSLAGLGAGLVASAGLATAAALLLQSLLQLADELSPVRQRLGAAILLLGFLALLAALEIHLQGKLLRCGRTLELRWRVAFAAKLRRVGLPYFLSRPRSDMAQRGHSLATLRRIPQMIAQAVRSGAMLIATLLGLAWLAPPAAPALLLMLAVTIAAQISFRPALREHDLRFRTQAGALTQFYLDALLGALPLRAHRAEASLLAAHEALLTQWRRSGFQLLRLTTWLGGLQGLAGTIAAIAVLAHARAGNGANVLLLAFWALSLPVLGQALAQSLQQYPAVRSLLTRLLEPLGAPDEAIARPGSAAAPPARDLVAESRRGVAIAMRNVEVRLRGELILDDVSLDIEPGSHVAIVGASGAGKSTLAGLLLGWRGISRGAIQIDGAPLDPQSLRGATAWIDPMVQLWDDTVLRNCLYGSEPDAVDRVRHALHAARLHPVLKRLPDGLQTRLGENGAMLSGGEGQRVRLARALMRSGARLAILDEPFRGLDRPTRRQLLGEARQAWSQATLLCITHDVAETRAFPRVLVIEAGRIVEDGEPDLLAACPGSRYRALLQAESESDRDIWRAGHWRRWRLDAGAVSEEARRGDPETRAGSGKEMCDVVG